MTDHSENRRAVLLLIGIASVAWAGVSLFFVASGFDWIGQTDCGWYMRVSGNPAQYNPSFLPGYPTIIWLLSHLFPDVSPEILMQALSLICYVGSVLMAYHILVRVRVSLAVQGALLFALFPLTGVSNTVMPRVDAVSYALCMSLFLTYVTNRTAVLGFLLAFGLTLHYSVWLPAGVILLVGLYERRLALWTPLVIGLPLLLYLVMGAVATGNPQWLLQLVVDVSQFRSELPIMDGLIGSFILGLSGQPNKLARGLCVLAHLLLALGLLWEGSWKRQRWLLAMIVPPVVLGLVLPRYEIWAMRDYTMYLALPLVVWLDRQRWTWLHSRAMWAAVLLACFLSQFAWAYYLVHTASRQRVSCLAGLAATIRGVGRSDLVVAPAGRFFAALAAQL